MIRCRATSRHDNISAASLMSAATMHAAYGAWRRLPASMLMSREHADADALRR